MSHQIKYRVISNEENIYDKIIVTSDGGVASIDDTELGTKLSYYQKRIDESVTIDNLFQVLEEGKVYSDVFPYETDMEVIIDGALTWLIDGDDEVSYHLDDSIFPNLSYQEYEFEITQKVTCWTKSRFVISARSPLEANSLAINYVKNDSHEDAEIDIDHLWDTLQELSPIDNGGEATLELSTDSGELIYVNI